MSHVTKLTGPASKELTTAAEVTSEPQEVVLAIRWS